MKNKKFNILVFPCGSEIGLEIHNSLKWSTYIELFGASSSLSNHGKYVFKKYIEGMPFFNEPDFISKLNTVINKYKIDFVFPANDDVLLKLAEEKRRIKCKIIISPLETCRICRSKEKTYRKFNSLIKTPDVYEKNDNDFPFPIFLKPKIGQGSKGIYLAYSKNDINFYLNKDPSLLILEYLPGKEYTIDCFTDRHRNLRFVGARERIRIRSGISVDTKAVFDTKFNKIAKIINETLKFRGMWFFQVKKTKNNELTLMEIAPRVSGTMGFYRNLGVNFELLSIFDKLNMDIQININNYFIEMDRALINRFKINLKYSTVYIDLDDTVIKDKKINPFILAFIFQCKNRNIRTHLLTKHAKKLRKTLERYHIESLFDTVSNLKKEEEKTNFIRDKSSIFIDDSFFERRKVSEKLGIPVFDSNALESLLDWKD